VSDLKAVMIGCGRRAAEYAAGIKNVPGVSCAACADVDRERADALAADYHLTAYYEAMEMMEIEAPDIIAIFTPFGSRAKLTRMCAEKRIPAIIVQTPVVRTLTQARDLIELCRVNRTLLMLSGQTPSQTECEPISSCVHAVNQLLADRESAKLSLRGGAVQPEELVAIASGAGGNSAAARQENTGGRAK
jgi:hypothetical protein